LLATMLVAACGGGSSPSAPGPAPSPGDLVQVAPDRRGHGAGIDRSAALLPARPGRAGRAVLVLRRPRRLSRPGARAV